MTIATLPSRLTAAAIPLFLAAALSLPLAACGKAEAPAGAPKVHIATLEQLPQPLPLPYDEAAPPAAVDAAIDAAFARAKQNGKRVMVKMGGNWCSWCRMLAGVMALPEAKPYLDKNFEIVDVPVASAKGMRDRNLQVLKRFGVTVDGMPFIVVADADGKVLVGSSAVTDKDHHTPQTMLDWLAQWAPQHTGKEA